MFWFAKISDLLVGLFIHAILKLRGVPENRRVLSVVCWLFNPFTFTIGTRGNCEPIVCAMVLWIVLCLMNGVSFGLFTPNPSLFTGLESIGKYFCFTRYILQDSSALH